MKNGLLVLAVFAAAALNTSFSSIPSEKDVKVTVKYSFKGIEEGYDHDTRTEVYIDDELKGTSTVKKESQSNAVAVTTSKGKHTIRIINQAQYDGVWEDHAIANDYSIDCMYEAEINVKKSLTIELLFDLDGQTKRVK
ncbi:MAG: hypothetical protein SH857_17180 [Chitinophagales bacterium]|nr:hypothetical protein [Chitinophagales bacterium]